MTDHETPQGLMSLEAIVRKREHNEITPEQALVLLSGIKDEIPHYLYKLWQAEWSDL